MAPQTSIPVAADVLGTIGTILWCVQLVPQIWTNWRTKSTDGLPGTMMFLWAVCGVPFGTYGIVQNFNMPIQVQPQCFMALCLVSVRSPPPPTLPKLFQDSGHYLGGALEG